MKIYAPWEKAFEKVATPLEHFIHAQTTTGIVLIFMTIVALILANSPLHDVYEQISDISSYYLIECRFMEALSHHSPLDK